MKKVPIVSTARLGPSTNGTAQSGISSSFAALPHAIKAFNAALTSAAMTTVLKKSQRRCSETVSRHRT